MVEPLPDTTPLLPYVTIRLINYEPLTPFKALKASLIGKYVDAARMRACVVDAAVGALGCTNSNHVPHAVWCKLYLVLRLLAYLLYFCDGGGTALPGL